MVVYWWVRRGHFGMRGVVCCTECAGFGQCLSYESVIEPALIQGLDRRRDFDWDRR